MTRLANREFETFTLIYLGNRHRLIACQDLFRGTIDVASVHPREVVKEVSIPPKMTSDSGRR